MSCRSTCSCQCQQSGCGCLSPGKQPPPRPKRPVIVNYPTAPKEASR